MGDIEFLRDFHDLALIGRTPQGGVTREAATTEDNMARGWFEEFARAHGWQVHVDGIGNMFALVPGATDAPYVLIGSHLDSQPRGGRYDGAYGVVAALHATARVQARLSETCVDTSVNLCVANWFNEEGARFPPYKMGSSVFAGQMDENEALRVRDSRGITVHDALEAGGYLGGDTRPVVAAYIEAHIEQGRVLENRGHVIGAVESSWCVEKLDIEILGEQSHTGSTAMADRRDALVGAAAAVLAVDGIPSEFVGQDVLASVVHADYEPDSPAVVVRRAFLKVDIRSPELGKLAAAREALQHRLAAIAAERSITINVRRSDHVASERFPEWGVRLTERVSERLGHLASRVQTIAGHDALPLNSVTPTILMFVPSENGLSHCETEYTSNADMVSGVDVLTELLWEVVNGDLPRKESRSGDAE